MNRFLNIVLFVCLSIACVGQLELDQELKMVGDSVDDRRVKNILSPTQGDHGVPLQTLRNQGTNHGASSGGSVINVTLTPAPTAYTEGMLVSFTLSSFADSAAPLQINPLPAAPLLKDGTQAIQQGELRVGVPYSAIYSNGVFHILKRTSAACPNGFDIVNRDYCIELQADTAVRWYTAAYRCADKNARLCTMGEWMRACKRLKLEPTISDWEWVDSAGNSSSEAKVMGLDPVNFSSPDCEYGRTYTPTLNATFRCCYSR